MYEYMILSPNDLFLFFFRIRTFNVSTYMYICIKNHDLHMIALCEGNDNLAACWKASNGLFVI